MTDPCSACGYTSGHNVESCPLVLSGAVKKLPGLPPDVVKRLAQEAAERRAPDRLHDSDLETAVLPNAAGGYLVKVSHRVHRRFASASGPTVEQAKRKASAALARELAKRERETTDDV